MSDHEEYEDDFETYDDDFESEDEIDEPTQLQTPSAGSENRERAAQSLPFKAAFGLSDAQRGHAARQWARLQQISQQVQLHEIVLDELFDLPALTEYELFSMGRGGYRGATIGSSQTNNDAITGEAQTDHVETASTACQVPESGSSDTANRGPAEESVTGKSSANLLLPFLQSAGAMVLNLLGAQLHNKASAHFTAPEPAQGQGVIAGSLTLHDAKLMQGRAVTSITCRDTDNLILAAYGPSGLQDAWHANMGCLCLWDLSEPIGPITSLISEGCPTACTFLATPGAGSLVLAGMQEGGLCLWDCRGSERHGGSFGSGTGHTPDQRPTYTTECHGTADMAGPVVALASLPRSPAPCIGQGELKQTRFLALTEWGNVSLWSVHVLASSEDAAGVQGDAGLQFGGHVRLLLLAASLPMGRMAPVGMQITETHKLNVQMHATTLAVLPEQHDQFVVATSPDKILRGSLYGQVPVPKEWHTGSTRGPSDQDGFSGLQQQVTCLSFSPFVADLMVVGHSGGLIAVYSMHSSTALTVVQVSAHDICTIAWSPSRPSLVMALDSTSCMVLLELTSQICHHRVVNLASVFAKGQHSAKVTKLSVHKVRCANTVEMPCNQLLIIALDTGQIKCCVLHQTLTDPQHDEKERMCTALRLPSA